MFYSYQFMIVPCSQIKKIKYMPLTKNRYKLKKQSWQKIVIFVFQFCNWREVEIKERSFFYNQIFPFSFSCTCLMDTFKKTEYNPISKVFTEVFLIARIPHSTILITEAVVQRCSVKKVFLKISQNSQKNMCARTSFLINLQALQNF